MNHILKKLGVAFAIIIILAAVFSSTFRALTPWAKQYKPEVEGYASQLLGHPVSIQSMQTGWYWLQPVLKFEHITFRGQDKNIHIEKLLVGIDLFKSLLHWRIQPGVLYLEGTTLVFREQEGHWQLDGFTDKPSNSSLSSQQIIALLAQQERLIVSTMINHGYI